MGSPGLRNSLKGYGWSRVGLSDSPNPAADSNRASGLSLRFSTYGSSGGHFCGKAGRERLGACELDLALDLDRNVEG